MNLPFSKYHGAGNDFIMIDNRGDCQDLWSKLTEETIKRLCRRHHGIGADGLIVAVKVDNPEISYSMVYFNSDGRTAEMCGNGLRCLMRFLHDLGEPVQIMEQVRIMTGAGVVACSFTSENLIRVQMPNPSFSPRMAKIITDQNTVRLRLKVPGLDYEVPGTAVGVGNPHFVIYNYEMWEGSDIHEIGSRLSIWKDMFPEGVNVGFARKESSKAISLAVWERGVGPTLACGSGAVAAVAAGIAEDRFHFDQPIEVRMPGGMLKVTIGDQWSSALLEGDAVKVFDGIVAI